MYEIYLAVGIILLLAGIVTIVFQIWLLKSRAKYNPSAVLFLPNTIATILVGGAYVYFTNILMNSSSKKEMTNPTYKIPDTIDTVEVADLLDFANSTNRFINKILSSTFRSPKAIESGRLPHDKKLQLCMPYNVLLQYVMVTYSFVQALIIHINTTWNCQNCSSRSPQTAVNPNEDIDKNSEKVIQSQYYKALLLQLIIVLLLPPLCASLLYFMTNYEEINPAQNEIVTQYLHNLINTSTAVNESQTNMVVENVYKIISELKPNSTIPTETTNPGLLPTSGCYTINTAFKINLFFMFIVSYFATILYSVMTYFKAKPNISIAKARNLKIMSYGFSSSWLTCIAEILIRIFLSEDLPDLIGQILKGLGNCNHLLINISNFLTHKKMLNENYVQPIE